MPPHLKVVVSNNHQGRRPKRAHTSPFLTLATDSGPKIRIDIGVQLTACTPDTTEDIQANVATRHLLDRLPENLRGMVAYGMSSNLPEVQVLEPYVYPHKRLWLFVRHTPNRSWPNRKAFEHGLNAQRQKHLPLLRGLKLLVASAEFMPKLFLEPQDAKNLPPWFDEWQRDNPRIAQPTILLD